MGNKLGHSRKIEPTDDASVSAPRDTFDLSNADPTDSEVLDEQAVLDILESSPYAPSDQSSGDGQDDITALSRTYVLKPSTLNERMSIEELAELAENSDDSETTMEQRDPANN
jgi:hypothetical protein